MEERESDDRLIENFSVVEITAERDVLRMQVAAIPFAIRLLDWNEGHFCQVGAFAKKLQPSQVRKLHNAMKGI